MRFPPGLIRSINLAALIVASGSGLLAFGLPFIVAATANAPGAPTRTLEASLLLAIVTGAAVMVAAGELARIPLAGSASRIVAILGVLVAVDASLRLVPSFLGASPIFSLIILIGFVFGPEFGFAMGALTLLLSGVITAGVGPWLPFQMLCAGWVGLVAGCLLRPSLRHVEIFVVASYGALAGFAYGALMNLYSWPYSAPGIESDVGLFWSPSLSLGETIARYATFYVATSLFHDATRAAANVILILVVGTPVLRLLRRFRTRSHWALAAGDQPEPGASSEAAIALTAR